MASFTGLLDWRVMRSTMLWFSTIGRSKAIAIPSIVRSSWVGPMPPEVNT